MRKAWLVASLLVAFPQIARSQTKTSTDALRQQIKEELREELREELKEELKSEIKSELASEGAAAGPVQEDAWAEEEWKWEEPVKPELNFLEFDGYFRFRYDLFNKLDLNTYYFNPEDGLEYGPFAPGFSPPTPACNTDQGTRGVDAGGNPSRLAGAPSCANGAGPSSTLGGANMRLRLEPVFNVYEDIKIKMQMDILDNVILGSTPDGFPRNPISPLLGFSQTQVTPSDGVNALTDSIRVKRAWAEIMTPLGQLRVGRMPSHFGMGLLANGGQGIDSDFGDTNDRVMFATKIGDFYIVPGYDWALSGPTSAQRELPYGQPFDRDNRDDVDQYLLAVVKRDTDEQMKQKLENDELVLNFGTYHVGRFQSLDAATYYQSNDPESQAQTKEFIERDMQAWAYSFWGQLIYRKFTIEAEYTGIIGRIGNSAFSGPYGTTDKELHINQHAGALNMEYKLLRDALTIRLLAVAATGDSAAGWGIRPLLSGSNSPGQWDGSQAPDGDDDINNFRIDPDFVVDMILWRQLVGMVTDALIIRPGVQYNLTEGFGGSLDLVYSRAWFSNSTPSGSFTDLDKDGAPDLGSPNPNLGIELDFKVFFDSEDGFHAWLQYGLFIPLAGLDRRVIVESNSPLLETPTNVRDEPDGPIVGTEDAVRLDASIAHTIQIFLGVSF
jgi:uncharacterized protein (TIGR04551 family)